MVSNVAGGPGPRPGPRAGARDRRPAAPRRAAGRADHEAEVMRRPAPGRRRVGLPRRLHAAALARLRGAPSPGASSTSTPACCPAFPGLDAQRQALEHGVKVSGCTVHLVDDGLDSGPIVVQRTVPVLDGDTPETPRRAHPRRGAPRLPRGPAPAARRALGGGGPPPSLRPGITGGPVESPSLRGFEQGRGGVGIR